MTSCQGAKGTGTLYSYAQLEGLWINAGGSSALAPTMAAIAEAESGGCSTAYNASGATGLWQILGAVDPSDQANLTDPATNAKEAVLKYKDQGLGAWVTYTSGAYKAYMNGATTPDTSVPGTGTSATLTSATEPASCLLWFPGISVPIVGNVGGSCLVHKPEARAVIGAGLMAAGVIVAGAGLLILAAFGLGKSGALARGADAAAVIPGAGAVAEGLTVAHRRSTQSGSQVTSDRRGARVAAQRQEARRQAAAKRAAKKKTPAKPSQPSAQSS
jgi:hypothetical protein